MLGDLRMATGGSWRKTGVKWLEAQDVPVCSWLCGWAEVQNAYQNGSPGSHWVGPSQGCWGRSAPDPQVYLLAYPRPQPWEGGTIFGQPMRAVEETEAEWCRQPAQSPSVRQSWESGPDHSPPLPAFPQRRSHRGLLPRQ